MKKAEAFLSRRPLLVAFGIVFFLFSFELLFFKPYFIINDDSCALLIYKGLGIAPQPDEHVMYINVLLGLVLKWLYTLFPSFSWYSGFLILVQFLAWWAFLSAILLKARKPFPVFLFGICFFLIGQFFFLRLSYTIVAYLAFLGGFSLMVVLPGPEAKGRSRICFVLGAGCFILSSLIRLGAFGYGILCILPLLVFGGGIWKGKKKALIVGGLLTLILLALPLAEFFYYQQDPAWKEFHHFFYQGEIPALDLKDPEIMGSSPAAKPFFDRIGWTLNDFELLRSWYFLDKDKYTIENLRQVGEVFHHRRFLSGGEFLRMFLDPFPLQVLICFAALLPFCLRSRFRLLMGFTVWILLLIFLQKSFARAPQWVFFPELSSLPLLALFFTEPPPAQEAKKKEDSNPGKLAWIFMALLAALALFNLAEGRLYDEDHRGMEKQLEADLTRLNPQDDQLFIVWGSTFPYEIPGAFDSFESFRHFHIFSLSGLQRSPLSQVQLERFHLMNPFREMVDNPHCFLICSPIQGMLYVKYMKERFNLKIRAVKRFKSPFFSVYRICSLD